MASRIRSWLRRGSVDHPIRYFSIINSGRTTRDLIALQIYNTAEEYCDGAEDYCNRLAIFLLQNLQYMREQIEKNPKDIYWRHVRIVMMKCSVYRSSGQCVDQPIRWYD